MTYKMFVFILVFFCTFAGKTTEANTIEFVSKMQQGFALQSMGRSTAAFFTFNEGYQAAIRAGISPQRMYIIGNLFNWYRCYGHYLGIFLKDPTGADIIGDEYTGQFTSKMSKMGTYSLQQANPKRDYKDHLETAALANEMILGFYQVVGGLLGVVYLPNATWKGTAGMMLASGSEKIWNSFKQLKLKNDTITYEMKTMVDKINKAAAEKDENR